MVHLITGPIGSGKTTLVMEMHETLGGGGCCCPKVTAGNRVIGYDLVELGGSRRVPFIRKSDALLESWNEADRIGPWRFNRAGFDMAREVIGTLIASRTGPVFLDEIGPLELAGRGFAPLLSGLLSSGLDCWLVVRDSLITDVIQRFQLKTYDIFKTGGTQNHD